MIIFIHLTGKDACVADIPLRGLKLSVSYVDGRLTLPESALNLPGGTVVLERKAHGADGGGHQFVHGERRSAGFALVRFTVWIRFLRRVPAELFKLFETRYLFVRAAL